MQRNAKETGNKPAVVFEDRTLTWADLWQLVERRSHFFLNKLGNNEQKVVDLLLTNSIDFVVTYLAVLHAGHIVLPLDPAYKKLELEAIIGQIPPALLITEQRYENQIGAHKDLKLLVSELPNNVVTGLKPLRLDAKDQVASLTFTSGTSGKPKAVPNTHANHAWNIKVCSIVWDWTADDSLLISLPLSHWYGLVMGLAGCIYHGNTLYLQDQSFDPVSTLELLSSGKITMFTHVPLAYMKILEPENNGRYDLSGMRVCISGGAALPPSVWQQFKKTYGIEIVETYGSSETGRIAGNSLGKRVVGSPGKILPEVDMKLSDESEVLIKSPGLFPGYYHNPEATKKSFTKDGYWRTGDIAELRDDYIFLKGRAQERIRRFSYTVSPRDVEWAMQQNSKVKDIFVMGRQIAGKPNDELIYFIVTDLNDDQIHDYCKTNLLFAWRPDKIIHLDELPRTHSGKAKLSALKEMAVSLP